jgi:hypothetical protein
LHDKIESLQARIKELEAALAQLQSKVASDPHPLLAQSLKTATEGLQSENETSKDHDSDNDDGDLIDTFGSLTIDTKGETVWYVVRVPIWPKSHVTNLGTVLMRDLIFLFS